MARRAKSIISVGCSDCHFREASEWCALTDDQVEFVDATKTSREYGRGEILFHEGDESRGVYCIKSGLVGIRKTDADGNSILLGRLGYPGSTLGYRPFLAGECHRGSAEALKTSIVCFIDGQTVRGLLNINPALGLNFLESTAKALGKAEEDYFQSAAHSLRTQILHLLLVFKDRYGKIDDDGSLLVELPVSRQDLAAMVGARPESMSRAIRDLSEQGIAKFSGRMVQIPNVNNLFTELEPEFHL